MGKYNNMKISKDIIDWKPVKESKNWSDAAVLSHAG